MLNLALHPQGKISLAPQTVIGRRKDGRPIYNIAGASPEGDTVTIPVPPAPAPEQPPAPSFTVADLEKVRKEEKDKLYGRLSEWETKFQEQASQLANLQAAKDAEIAAAAEKARKDAEEQARKQWEEQDSKTLLAQAQQEWEAKFASLEQERQQERALFAKEQEFNLLSNYAQSKVQSALQNNEIAPELADFVTGNSQAEIDASLEIVKAKSEAIVSSIAAAQTQMRAQMPGVSPTGYSTSGPMDTNSTHQTFSTDQLKNMSMSEYARLRGSLLPAASGQQNRGLYG